MPTPSHAELSNRHSTVDEIACKSSSSSSRYEVRLSNRPQTETILHIVLMFRFDRAGFQRQLSANFSVSSPTNRLISPQMILVNGRTKIYLAAVAII